MSFGAASVGKRGSTHHSGRDNWQRAFSSMSHHLAAVLPPCQRRTRSSRTNGCSGEGRYRVGTHHRWRIWNGAPLHGVPAPQKAWSLVSCPANNLHMKPHLHTHGGVANPRDSTGYRCGLRLALGANPSVSFHATICGTGHQMHKRKRLPGGSRRIPLPESGPCSGGPGRLLNLPDGAKVWHPCASDALPAAAGRSQPCSTDEQSFRRLS
jgi:hypothetical protein